MNGMKQTEARVWVLLVVYVLGLPFGYVSLKSDIMQVRPSVPWSQTDRAFCCLMTTMWPISAPLSRALTLGQRYAEVPASW